MRARTGKIAKLPREVRDELNRRLDNGEDGAALLKWLNRQPATLKVADEQFGGKPVNKQNLSDWRQGGYVDWQRQQEALELAGRLLEDAEDMEQLAKDGLLPDRMNELVAVTLGHLLQSATRLPEGPQKYRAVIETARELARLRRGNREWERALREEQDWRRKQEERAIKKEQDRAIAPLFALVAQQAFASYVKTARMSETEKATASQPGSATSAEPSPVKVSQGQSSLVKPCTPPEQDPQADPEGGSISPTVPEYRQPAVEDPGHDVRYQGGETPPKPPALPETPPLPQCGPKFGRPRGEDGDHDDRHHHAPDMPPPNPPSVPATRPLIGPGRRETAEPDEIDL